MVGEGRPSTSLVRRQSRGRRHPPTIRGWAGAAVSGGEPGASLCTTSARSVPIRRASTPRWRGAGWRPAATTYSGATTSTVRPWPRSRSCNRSATNSERDRCPAPEGAGHGRLRRPQEWFVTRSPQGRGRPRDRDGAAAILETLPNILDADVPEGPDESANVVLTAGRRAARVRLRPAPAFRTRRVARADGFRGRRQDRGHALHRTHGGLARLERALGQFMIDLHIASTATPRSRAAAGERHDRLWHRPVAEIRGRPVQDHRRPLPDPNGRGAADQPPGRRDHPEVRLPMRVTALTIVSARRRGRRGATRAGCCASTSSEGGAGLDHPP